MRAIVRFQAVALGLAIAVTGCASPPNADVDAAKAAVDRAATDARISMPPGRSRLPRMPAQPSTPS